MAHLDLVITVDSAVVAPRRSSWPCRSGWLLSTIVDWRLDLLQRGDTPWYPTMRLFRQKRLGEWDSVMARMAQELCRQMSDDRGRLPTSACR